MRIYKGIGEPIEITFLRLAKLKGIYISYAVYLFVGSLFLGLIVNMVFNNYILIPIPILVFLIGLEKIKNLQKKYGTNGRFQVRASALSKMKIQRKHTMREILNQIKEDNTNLK